MYIKQQHFDIAIDEAIENAQESIREVYHRAVMTTKKETKFRDVISACVLVKADEYGTFRATDLQEPLEQITGEKINPNSYFYHLDQLCKDEKGGIIQRIGQPKKYRYRFRSPLLKAFVRLKIYQSRQLSCTEL